MLTPKAREVLEALQREGLLDRLILKRTLKPLLAEVA